VKYKHPIFTIPPGNEQKLASPVETLEQYR